MFYLKAFFNSLYNVSWLNKNRKEFLAVIYTAFIFRTIPDELGKIKAVVNDKMPEFSLSIENGELNVENLEQPFIQINHDEEGTFVFVVDTTAKEEPLLTDYIDTKTEDAFLATKNNVYIHNSKTGQTNIQSLSAFNGLSLSKKKIEVFLSKYSDGIPFFLFFILLAVFYVAVTVKKLVYLLLISLLIWFVARFGKEDEWKYSEVYTVGMYAITLPSLISTILFIIGYGAPFLYTILLTLLMFFVVFMKEKGKKIKTIK